MVGRRIKLKSGHGSGKCGVVVHGSGTVVLTSGADGTVCAISLEELGASDHATLQEKKRELLPDVCQYHKADVGVSVLAMTPSGSFLATGDDDANVRLFKPKKDVGWHTSGSIDFQGIVTRFQAPVRALAFAPSGGLLACAGDEPGVIKLVSTANPSQMSILRSSNPHKGGDAIKQLAYDPQGDFVLSVGARHGALSLWGIDADCYMNDLDFGPGMARCAEWSPCGDWIAAGSTAGLSIVSRRTQKLAVSLSGGHARNATVLSVSWSSNAQYLLSSDDEGIVVLWEVSKREPLDRWRAEFGIQSVVWNPVFNHGVVMDKMGQYGLLDEVVPLQFVSPHATVEGSAAKQAERANQASLEDLFKDEEVAEQEQRAKRKTKHEHEEKRVGEDDRNNGRDEDEDEDAGESLGEEDTDEGEDVSGSDEDEQEHSMANNVSYGAALKKRRRSHGGVARRRVALPDAFMPSSTPLRGKRRILCWNLRGVVTSEDESIHHNIEISFADGNQPSVRFKDHYGFIQGCLGTAGAFFASTKTAEHPSVLFYHALGSWSKKADWSVNLPQSEQSKAIAISSDFVACVSSARMLRVFTHTGVQTDSMPIPGPAVTLTARDDRLAVVYCTPDAAISVVVLELDAYQTIAGELFHGPVSTSPESLLVWAGFAETRGPPRSLSDKIMRSDLVLYDNLGRACALSQAPLGYRWRILLDNAAKLAQADYFWPLAFKQEGLAVGVKCHGIERYPSALTRPLLTTIGFEAPSIDGTARLSSQLMRLRGDVSRAQSVLTYAKGVFGEDHPAYLDIGDELTDAELQVDKCLLKLIEEACQTARGTRALELAARLNMPKSIDVAYKLAMHYNQTLLADRIIRLSQTRALKPAPQRRTRRSDQAGGTAAVDKKPSMPVNEALDAAAELVTPEKDGRAQYAAEPLSKVESMKKRLAGGRLKA
ncbi:Minichromosome loss protein 1 [Porphyridium purpureum]|uniref:Minichromosome loss protein 1 n=1 Tax=Porphyridium purpureum TaxID=35688 RepID=A0A5J4YJ77_PORPP|nr:Minichromosome loss protein 1 [Porphyridium purpureum]|eukprot:POR7843..scf251_18